MLRQRILGGRPMRKRAEGRYAATDRIRDPHRWPPRWIGAGARKVERP
jgi:hypothetical protein